MRIWFALLAVALALPACSGGTAGGAPRVPASSSPSVAPTSSPTTAPTTSPKPVATPTGTPSASASLAPARATIGSCTVFPAYNAWNEDVSHLAVDANSSAYLAEMNPSGATHIHPDFGSDPSYGIPINVDTISATDFTPIAFTLYPDESDPGPYPIPSNPAVEAGSDHHMLIVDQTDCKLYETWMAQFSGGAWSAANGAVFDLGSDALRPEGWTSADAAGLPIAAGLVRYAEVRAGAIDHAIRFTMSTTFKGHIHPATHDAGGSVANSPPMGCASASNRRSHSTASTDNRS